jgi:dinuclear metal center YbgI/SA1388 family protein
MQRPQTSSQNPRVADIIARLEQIAPPALAEQWDNCGLQIGSIQRPARKIWVALDPLFSVIEAATNQRVDLLITHHPLILQPLNRLDLSTSIGKSIETALLGRLTIYTAHTNLDSTPNGINDMLARRIGLHGVTPLQPLSGSETDSGAGLGRVGRLEVPMTVEDLARWIKDQLKLEAVKVAGDMTKVASHAAICSGSGSSLIDAFLATNAEVFISGDLRYHSARTIEEAGRALIDVGHFPSEHIVVEELAMRLDHEFKERGWCVQVEPCRLEHDPFRLI